MTTRWRSSVRRLALAFALLSPLVVIVIHRFYRRANHGLSDSPLDVLLQDRTVLVLRHFSELSYREIAQALDLDEKTVKSRLFEARQRLRTLLGDLRDARS